MKLGLLQWKCKFSQVAGFNFWQNGFFAIAALGVTLGAFYRVDSLLQLFLRNPMSTSTSLYDHPFPTYGRFLGGGWIPIFEIYFFLLSKATNGVIPGDIWVLKVH